MKSFSFLAPFITIFMIRCNLGINTTDPQSSSNIEQSIEKGLFVGRYEVKKLPDSIFNVEEAWVEYTWKNDLSNGKLNTKRTNEIQLNLKIKESNASILKQDNYLIDWEMEETINGYFGKSNGVYVLLLKSNNLPDSLTVAINRIPKTSHSYQFVIYKK